ncbi:phosphatase PAP2 family protein [Rufibacter quisquiliarum]|uniref:Undecaprenyl-diphosphatase n=1 Tax=Rufibacter quisquiliarum TaxID=1549639 RepID=A0A839GP98_9BACT|nr:phosphatase PAP2 family protein [Rufibacter quisquiliarum]MBA9077355.1 undecaprenyl-diphosphatase [Rufibacter quisquiliarum]
METLKSLDQALFLELNSRHTPFWDQVMVLVTNKYVWVPFYLLLIILMIYFYRRRGALMVLTLGASVGLADFIASGIFKPFFARLRPCHDAVVGATVQAINGCGGKYGFVSSHAANSFAIAAFFCFLLPARQWPLKVALILWASLISYSRIYLGVHYPGDITVGAAIGVVTAWLGIYLYHIISERYRFWRV